MTEPTPLYRNLILDHAIAEGCPSEVTKEAWALLERRYEADHGINDGMAADMLDAVDKEAFASGVAYGYTAGRVARWDALVKGSPRLIDAIMKSVHEFFHDEPFGQHDGVAHECTDCSTVSALAADAAAAHYAGDLPSGTADVYAEDLEGDLVDEDDEYTPEGETEAILADPRAMADLAEAAAELGNTSALHSSVPNEWRVADDAEIRHG